MKTFLISALALIVGVLCCAVVDMTFSFIGDTWGYDAKLWAFGVLIVSCLTWFIAKEA